MSSAKKSIEVSLSGSLSGASAKTVRVSWYEGASDDSIHKALCGALGLDEATRIVLRDGDGDSVAISNSLPSGLKVVAEISGASPEKQPPATTTATTTMVTPRGPKPYPFVGNLPEFFGKGGPFEPMKRMTREYGDFLRLKVPRGQVFLNSDPEVVADLLHRPEDFPKIVTTSPSPLRKLRESSAAADGLFTTDDNEEIWHVAHRVLVPALGLGALKQYYPRMLEVADELVHKLATLRPDEPFLVTDMMTRMTFEAISYTGFNRKWGCIDSEAQPPFVQAMVDVLVIGMESAGNLLPDLFHPITTKKREQANRILLDTVDHIIEERRAALERGDKVPNDILQAMLTTRDKVTGKRLPDENIRAQLITFLIAGHETTSGLLSYALHAIARAPEVERKLQAEADAVLGRDYSYTPTFQDIEKLDYTQRVLKEALRLHPTAPAFARKSVRDNVVAGKYAVPADSTIITFLPALHSNARYWSDAERFDPDRFLPDAVAARHPDAYHPFGIGMRSCIGFQFALIEAKLVLARMFQRFTPRLADPEYKLENIQTLTIKPKDLYMTLAPRAEERGRGPTISANSTAATVQAPAAASSEESGTPVLILYGSNMGGSQDVAQTLARKARARGYAPDVQELDTHVGKLPVGKPVIIISSTYNGNPPDNATRFYDWLRRTDLASDVCKGVTFAVLGCGNKQWKTTFQKFPRFIDARLRELGADSFFPIGACDADGDFESAAEAFCDGIFPAMITRFGSAQAARPAAKTDDAPLYTVEIVNFAGTESASAVPSRYPLHEQAFWTSVLKNEELQSADSGRSTRHIELSLPDGVTYTAGDHLGVFPENPASLVNAIAERCGARLSDVVILRPNSAAGATAEALPCGIPITVFDLLTYHIDLAGPLSRKELRALARACPCPPERTPIEALCQDAAFRSDVLEAKLSLYDVLTQWKSIECDLTMLLSLRPLLKPRYYSISSSPRVLPNAVSITASVHSCPRRDGSLFEGLCSHYLQAQQKGVQLRVVVKDTKSTFRLPEDASKDVILIGPGTGLAPLRGFIAERAAQRRAGVSVGQTVLFFGCRNPEHDYLYRSELEAYVKDGTLNALHVAFSREPGKPKTYVQHQIREQRESLRSLIERGAYVYICGDAKNMAPDVQTAFTELLQAPTMDKLRAEGRYLQDVWAST